MDCGLAPSALHRGLRALGARHTGATPSQGWLSLTAIVAHSLPAANNGIRGFEPDGFVEISDRLVAFLLLKPDSPTLTPSPCVAGARCNLLRVEVDRLIE